MNHQRSLRRLAVATLLGVTLVASGCGNDDTTASSDSKDKMSTTMAPASGGDAMTTTTMADAMEASDGPTGPGCSAVPADGAGSFAGMEVAPAATAASNNPVLSTLVAAVTAAGLGDTLNGPGPFTIFAPSNDAFAKIPEADLNAVLADKALLTKILTLHVVPGKMSAAELAKAGTVTTVEGSKLTFSGDAANLEVNGTAAVICGNVQVANATVHIIDTVLMPG